MKQLLLVTGLIVGIFCASAGRAFADGNVSTNDTFFHVKERGLTFDKAIFLDGRQNPVPTDTRFAREDSMYFAPYLTGWSVEQGMVTVMWSMRILSPSGKLLYAGGTGNKTLERYPVAVVNDVPFMIELGKLKTNDPYYTIEFSITDKASSKRCDGSFRVLLQ
jgi:hypothetical protein